MEHTDNLQKKIIGIIQDQLESQKVIETTTTFEEIKLNSIAFVKIIVQIEDELDISFNLKMIDIEQYVIIKDLIDYVEEIRNNEDNR